MNFHSFQKSGSVFIFARAFFCKTKIAFVLQSIWSCGNIKDLLEATPTWKRREKPSIIGFQCHIKIVYSLYGLYPLLRLIFLPSFWFHFQLREYFELNRRINHKKEIFTTYIKLSVCLDVFLLHFQFEEQTHNLRCLDRKCWHILYHPKQSKIHRKR